MSRPGDASVALDSLAAALAEHHCVSIRRSIDAADVVVGYVVALGPQWLLLKVSDGASANGWVALRTRDVSRVEPADGARFARRGLEGQHSWPPAAPTGTVSVAGGTRALLGSVAAAFSVVTMYRERRSGASCLVGRPGLFSSGEVEWQELSPDAVWQRHVTLCRSSAITRIDFGGRYELALAHAADLRALLSTRGAQSALTRGPASVEQQLRAELRPIISLA
jgi:hypothetical protein